MSTLTLHRGSVGLGLETLRTGRDLVLEPAAAHGLAIPDGAVLDDYLEPAGREAVTLAAAAALAGWRERLQGLVTVAGVDLAHVAEVELLARCFLPAARLRQALPSVLRSHGVTAVTIAGESGGLLDVAIAVAVEQGAAVAPNLEGASGEPPRYGWRGPGRAATAVRAAVQRSGVPPRVCGRVVCVPYWHLVPLHRRMTRTSGLRPVAAGVALPALGRRDALGVAVRGGWLGVPSARARERSRAAVDAALVRAAVSHPGEPIEAAVHALALDVLRTIAADAPGEVAHASAALAGSPAALLLLPWDSPAPARVLLAAAAPAGVGSLLIQHGFSPGPGDPDKLLADRIGAWSERDAAEIARLGRERDAITVTGNPGASHLAAPAARVPARGRTILLVEMPARQTAGVDARISARHVAAGLAGLAVSRAGSEVVVRPHPGEPLPEAYGSLAAGLDLRVSVDTHTPIEPLVRSADLVVGAISTATLQAAALGVPVVFLDLVGIARPWPFDGTPDGLPRARGAEELAALVPGVLGASDVPGAPAAREALGARPDAIERCLALAQALAQH
jgi:hypothetical protein